MTTFYWHDYETWGADPSIDRPSQFAGVRTNENLDIIDEPLVMYCQPPIDVLPHPEACLVTGILPQTAQKEGLKEPEFIEKIHAQFSVPDTCGAGYNSIRFDDEVTRFTLYRNFYDPYEREWRNGNSRWDIIDMVRLCYALRPEGIDWPMVEGKPSFKLENLTQANGLTHTSAHDAFSDVEATIALAKLIKQAQPGLYDYVFNLRKKAQLQQFIDIRTRKPFLHTSSMFPSENGCTALVMPIAMHPTNKNAVIVCNLSDDPSPLIQLSADDIAQRLFTPKSELPEDVKRVNLKAIHLNKCPIVATSKLLSEQYAQRLHIDKHRCEQHWHTLLQHDLAPKVRQVFSAQQFAPRTDPERQLYDGFLNDDDKKLAVSVRRSDEKTFQSMHFTFQDTRLNTLLFRFKGRYFPQALSEPERVQWREFCRQRIIKGDEACLSLADVKKRIEQLTIEHKNQPEKLHILNGLEAYLAPIEQQYKGLSDE